MSGLRRFLGKVVPLALLTAANLMLTWAVFVAHLRSYPLWLTMLFVLILILFNIVYFYPKAYPFRYMFPGVVVFLGLMLYPMGYTVYVSTTNLGTGHYLYQEDVTQILLSETIPAEAGASFGFQVGILPDSKSSIAIVLFQVDNKMRFLTAVVSSDHEANVPIAAQSQSVPSSTSVSHAAAEWLSQNGYERASLRWIIENQRMLEQIKLKRPDTDQLLMMTSMTRFSTKVPRFKFIDANTLVDQVTQIRYVANAETGFYEDASGQELLPGFVTHVGFRNFLRTVMDPQIVGPFFKVFLWTIVWAFMSVFLTFAFGLALSLVLQQRRGLKGKVVYRILLTLPYAMPFFISVLIWKGMFNEDFGVLNALLQQVANWSFPWLEEPLMAKMSCLIVNLWLGFPYMMLVTTGILQSIPMQIYEAAAVDGAGKTRRFFSLTLPMIMTAIAPLLVGSFAFNFNNFVGIYLLTGGGPPMARAQTPAGETDILASYTYRLAFEGGSGNDFGFAAAITLVIFLIIGVLSIVNFKLFNVMKEEPR